MRVVVLTDEHPPVVGGVATFTARVVEELVRRGHGVTVFARARPDLRPIAGAITVPVRGPSFGRFGGEWLGLRAAPALARADRVIATTWPVATLVARLGIPYRVVAHGSDLTRPPVRPRAFRRTWARAERRFAVSRFLVDTLAVAGFAAEVLPAAVRPGAAPVPPVVGGRWGLVGRAVPGKGGERFVRLVAAAGVRGVVVGDGPELPRWRAEADRVGARVDFVGALRADEVAATLSTLALVCALPDPRADGSGAEGLGLALIEAAALGVPVVGCRVGGVPEAVGVGLLLDAPDDPVASAARIVAWWTPERGREAWVDCRARHGVGRALDALLSCPDGR